MYLGAKVIGEFDYTLALQEEHDHPHLGSYDLDGKMTAAMLGLDASPNGEFKVTYGTTRPASPEIVGSYGRTAWRPTCR